MRVEIGRGDLIHVHFHFGAAQRFKIGAEHFNLRPLAPDHNAGFGSVDGDVNLVRETLDVNSCN